MRVCVWCVRACGLALVSVLHTCDMRGGRVLHSCANRWRACTHRSSPLWLLFHNATKMYTSTPIYTCARRVPRDVQQRDLSTVRYDCGTSTAVERTQSHSGCKPQALSDLGTCCFDRQWSHNVQPWPPRQNKRKSRRCQGRIARGRHEANRRRSATQQTHKRTTAHVDTIRRG